MRTTHKYPFYIRATVILFGLVLCSFALANLRGILIPFSFALFLAVLLNPLMERLLRWRVPRVAAIAVSLIVAILLISGVWYFLANQIMQFTDQLPLLQKKASELIVRLQQYLLRDFNIPIARTNSYLAEARAGIRPLLERTLGTVAGTMGTVFLLPMYTFLFVVLQEPNPEFPLR
jgi:predicted PurR-regulated permease PerM